MVAQVNPKQRFPTQKEPPVEPKPERIDAFHLQEQFSGAVPLRTERPAAELLVERLIEACPPGASPVFIP
jgi:hypothetical protein